MVVTALRFPSGNAQPTIIATLVKEHSPYIFRHRRRCIQGVYYFSLMWGWHGSVVEPPADTICISTRNFCWNKGSVARADGGHQTSLRTRRVTSTVQISC